MMQPKILALCLVATLSVPVSAARACIGETLEMNFEGDPNGKDPFKLTTPVTSGEPARTWVDDDGLITLMSVLQSVEDKKDLSAYSNLYKKSLERLAAQSQIYLSQSDQPEAQTHYKAVAEGAKKLLDAMKDRPLEKKDVEAFYEKMGETLKNAINDGVYGYQTLNPKTGKPEDANNPYMPIGYFGPAVNFVNRIDGASNRDLGCDTFSLKIDSSKRRKEAGREDQTFMIAPGE